MSKVNERGLEILALSIALDLEPHDPPEGMADRIFARIETESVHHKQQNEKDKDM